MKTSWRTRLRIAVLLSSVAAILLLAACGDDEGDQATTGSESPAATETTGDGAAANGNGTADGDSTADGAGTAEATDFTAAANEVCKRTRQELKSELEPFFAERQTGSPQKIAQEMVTDYVEPAFTQQINDLRGLNPTGTEAKQVEEIATSIEATLREAKANPGRFIKVPKPFGESEKLANQYGLTSCGRP